MHTFMSQTQTLQYIQVIQVRQEILVLLSKEQSQSHHQGLPAGNQTCHSQTDERRKSFIKRCLPSFQEIPGCPEKNKWKDVRIVFIELVETRQMFNSMNKNKEVVLCFTVQWSEWHSAEWWLQVLTGGPWSPGKPGEPSRPLSPWKHTAHRQNMCHTCVNTCVTRDQKIQVDRMAVKEEVAYFCPIASWDTRRTGWTIVSIDALFEAVKIPQTPSKLHYEVIWQHRPYIGYFNDIIYQCILIGVRLLIVQDVRHKGRLKNLRVVLDFLAYLADQEGPATTQNHLIYSQWKNKFYSRARTKNLSFHKIIHKCLKILILSYLLALLSAQELHVHQDLPAQQML